MKTTFGRIFVPVAIILLAVLLLVGVCFRAASRTYLEDQALDQLSNDAHAMADLASIYLTGSLTNREFVSNFTVAAQLSNTDAVLCSPNGVLLLCSDSPLGCVHQGSVIQDSEYLDRVLTQGIARDTGVVKGLYEETRFVVTVPVTDLFGSVLGLMMVSQPQEAEQAPPGAGENRQRFRPRGPDGPGPAGRELLPGDRGAGPGLQQHGLLPAKERVSAAGICS